MSQGVDDDEFILEKQGGAERKGDTCTRVHNLNIKENRLK